MVLQLRQSLILSQQLIMTPQLQQAIKLLQLNRLELLDTIHDELETNPILEEQAPEEEEEEKGVENEEPTDSLLNEVTVKETAREDFDWETYLSEYNTGWDDSPYEAREMPPFENLTSTKTNLHSHLLWQLQLSRMTDAQKQIGIHIIGNLDDDGSLKISVEELSQITGATPDAVLETLGMIQNFDPVGIAARDMQECLLIQARFQNLGGTVVEKIILGHMEKLENKKYDLIAKSLSVPLDDILSAVSVITSFEPKPGRKFNDEETIYISPDIYVFKVNEDYEITLNEDGLPKLRINAYYRDILSSKETMENGTKQYIQDKLRSAAWLIKSIHQRQ
ncbi:MAG: RNA polymerase sigma-54 factor, partial [Proteobacteria bacterium]|nr:RNA polymerase sigma-54 factor [Pseudomonadota bacterium]